MRWIRLRRAFVVGSVVAAAVSIAAAGCGFSAPKGGLSGDASTGADAPGDAPGMDAPPDTMPPDGPSPIRTRRIDITDAQVAGGPHTDFPLLVSITAPWLRPTAMGGDVASPSGFDLGFFADAAGTTRLAHEVEAYRSDATSGTLIAWVKVPSLAATSELFLRYGDPAITASQESVAAVWSNSFAAVWHLVALGDSTTNANTGTDGGTAGIGGQIGDARNFDATNDFIAVGSGTSIDNVFTGGGTIEAWFRASGWGEAMKGRILEKGDNSTGETNGWSLSVDDENASRAILFAHASTTGTPRLGAWNTPNNSVALNAWTHVAVVYDKGSTNNNPSIYINGAAVTLTERSNPGGAMVSDAADPARLGNRGAGDRTFSGRLDEVRLSTSSRSADWIITSYRNQSDPGTFYAVGDPL